MSSTYEKVKAWKRANPERVRAYNREYARRKRALLAEKAKRWRDNNPEKAAAARKKCDQKTNAYRKRDLRKFYGMSLEDWDRLFTSQGNACALCRTTAATRWHTDHCHQKGYVRGILCNRCNLGLGYFSDDPAKLEAAARYLRKNK